MTGQKKGGNFRRKRWGANFLPVKTVEGKFEKDELKGIKAGWKKPTEEYPLCLPQHLL